MPTVSDVRDMRVVDQKGKPIGTVNHVLFHPAEHRVIGFELRPRAYGYVVERKPQYYAYDAFELHDDHIELVNPKAASGTAAEKRLGVLWDETVIWSFQDVKTASGRMMGQVVNVAFSRDGDVRRITVSDGATADVAVGRQTVELEHIVGFDGDVIRVADAADRIPTTGGIATQAGKGAAVAKYAAEKAGGKALEVTVATAKAVAKSDTAKRAKKGWKDFKDAFKEGRDSGE